MQQPLKPLLGQCPLYEQIEKTEYVLTKNSSISYEKLCNDLGNLFDYSSEVVCEEPGQFSVRGGLIDVYPVNLDHPVRLDFFGDEIEEIRTFDPGSQRSTGTLDFVRILSISNNNSLERRGEFFKYLPSSVFWVLQEPNNLLHTSPLAFHETGNATTETANFSLSWKRENQVEDLYLATSEIDAGAGIFENSIRLVLKFSPFINPIEGIHPKDKEFLSSKNKHEVYQRIFRKVSKVFGNGFPRFASP